MAHGARAGTRWEHTGSGSGRGATVRLLVEALAFGCELAMVVVLGIAGWSLGSGGLLSIALMLFYPALAILIWAVWVAPQAGRRLGDPWRLGIQLLLFAATAALSAAGGHMVLGIIFGALAWASFIAARFTGGITGADTGPNTNGVTGGDAGTQPVSGE